MSRGKNTQKPRQKQANDDDNDDDEYVCMRNFPFLFSSPTV